LHTDGVSTKKGDKANKNNNVPHKGFCKTGSRGKGSRSTSQVPPDTESDSQV